jgi:hypothetical protein
MRRSILVALSLLGFGGFLPAQEEAPKEQAPPKVGIIDLINEIEGETTILKLVPEGTWVTKGQVVATLDSADLRNRLTDQQILTHKAQVDAEAASIDATDAALALKEYLEPDDPTKLADLKQELTQELKLAQDELSLRRKELATIEKLERVVPPGRQESTFNRDEAERVVTHLRRSLEDLKSARKGGEERQLKSRLTKARSQLLAAKSIYELQKSKEAKLVRQIRKCQYESPIDGVLIHPGPSGISSSDAPIQVGSKVREGQLLLRIVQVGFE